MKPKVLCILLYIISFIIIFFLQKEANAQFYNGMQLNFGKNRVQYQEYFWNYYRFDKYDIYFHTDGYELAEWTSDIIKEELPEVERFFGHSLNERFILIVFNKHQDFIQHNIGLVTGSESVNTGGTSKIIDNKAFVFFEGDREKFRKQVKKVLAKMVLNSTLYGGSMQQQITSSALMNIPDWYSKGLQSFVAEKWNLDIENKIRDGIRRGEYEKFNHFSAKEPALAGHSLWYYLYRTNGPGVIRNIIYMAQVNNDIEAGFVNVLGKSLKEVMEDWHTFYKNYFNEQEKNRTDPEGENVISWLRDGRSHRRARLSPDSKYLAYVSHKLGKYKIWIYNTETEKRTKVYTGGHKIKQITDYTYPVMAWNPKSKILSFVVEEKGHVWLYFYTIDEEKLSGRKVFGFEKILSYDYHSNGTDLVMSAIKNGQTDLFVFNIPANSSRRLTNGPADDYHPRFIDNSSGIIFASNRINDSLRAVNDIKKKMSPTFDIYRMDYSTQAKEASNITESRYSNEYRPYELADNIYTYLSDKNGIVNKHIAKYDSTISYVDTTTHYRYYAKTYPLSNYSTNMLDYSVASESLHHSRLFYKNDKAQLYQGKLNTGRDALKGDFRPTSYYRSRQNDIDNRLAALKAQEKKSTNQQDEKSEPTDKSEPGKKERTDSSGKAKVKKPPEEMNADSMVVDIMNYTFEREKYPEYYQKKEADELENRNVQRRGTQNSESNDEDDGMPRLRMYQTNFYKDQMVNKMDFGFINNSYQKFTGSAVYFNPGMTGLFKVGVKDLFENYRIVGGFRFSSDFNSNEFLVSLENLENRLDKQFIYHRQVIKQSGEVGVSKTRSHNLFFKLNYPFSQVSAIRSSLNVRYDKSTVLSQTRASLSEGNEYSTWTGQKLAYVFDNTRKIGLNLREGIRTKIFGEAYQEVDGEFNDLYVGGIDFRIYKRIHRSFIWAGRFAASTSLGSKRLVYYLGGVDGWMSFLSGTSKFNKGIPISQRDKYEFQTIATNMRGFSQNIRNGNSFALINTELRLPVIRYLFNRPLSSEFLNSLQVVGFGDFGSAWVGMSPYSKKNEFYTREIEKGPVKVIVENDRSAFVGGFGFGVRAKVFGYFLRGDIAWGVDNYEVLDPLFYLSMNFDF